MNENEQKSQASADEGKAIVFPQGLGGFEDYREFKLLHSEDADSPLYWLESIQEPTVSFTVIDPRVYGLNYVFELSDEESAALDCSAEDEVLVLLMLAKREADEDSQPSIYGNIAGPILINTNKRRACQKVLHRRRVELNVIAT